MLGLGLDGSHPEEQGLKLDQHLNRAHLLPLDGSHPEEQGLKPSTMSGVPEKSYLMGVIQKNKD